MWGGKWYANCDGLRFIYVLTVNRWLSIRFNLLSAVIVGATAFACLVTPGITASMAGFALAFASTVTNDLLFMVRRFVGLEQSMVWRSSSTYSGTYVHHRLHWSV